MQNRNTPKPFTPHSLTQTNVEGLRDYDDPPATYRSYRLVDGMMVFMGEFPTPEVKIGFNNSRKGK